MARKTTANFASPAPASKAAASVSNLGKSKDQARKQAPGKADTAMFEEQEASGSDKETKGHPAALAGGGSKRKRAELIPAEDDYAAAAAGGPEKEGQKEAEPAKLSKRARSTAPAKRPVSKTKSAIPKKVVANVKERVKEAPTTPLDIFVFGEGSGGELGLGSKATNGQMPVEVMRPRLNRLLSSDDVGVVQIACGGMHAIALTRDNRILTWGVNDLGALGRATNVIEEDDDELNPAESTPGPVDTSGLGPDIRWAQVVASDNASFALTEDGRVYGWGTFRVGSPR